MGFQPKTSNIYNTKSNRNASTYTQKVSFTNTYCCNGSGSSTDNSECCQVNASAIQDISAHLVVIDSSINYLMNIGDLSGINALLLDISQNVYDNSRSIIEVNQEVDDLSGVVRDLSSSVHDLSGEIFSLPSVVNDLSSVVLDLSGDHNTLNTAFLDLSGKVVTNTNNISTNTTNITSLTGVVNDLSSVVLDLSGDHNTLNNAFLDLSGKVVTNTTNIATKVSKTGDTMTGNLTIDKATPQLILENSSNNQGIIEMNDNNNLNYLTNVGRHQFNNNVYVNGYVDISDGLTFTNSTLPSNITNKLYRLGNDIYWDNDKLSVWDVSGTSLVLDSSYTELIIPGSTTSFGVDKVNKEAILFTDLSNIKLNVQGNNAMTLTNTGVDLSGAVNFANSLTAEKGLVFSSFTPQNTASTLYTPNGTQLYFNGSVVGDAGGDVTNLTNVVNDLSSVVLDLSGDHNTLNTAFLDLSGKVVTNTSNISTNTSNISTNTSNISTNTNNITSLTGVVNDLSSVVLDLSGDHNTLNTAFLDLSGKVVTNTSNISTNTSNISTNTSNISTNTSNITSLTGVVNDLSSVVLDLSGDHNTLNTAFLDLSGKVVTNTTDIATKVSKSGDTMTGNLQITSSEPQLRLTNTDYDSGKVTYQRVADDGYWELWSEGSRLMSGKVNVINVHAAIGMYLTGSLVFSGDGNDVVISKTGTGNKSLLLQAGDNNSSTNDDFAIDMVVRDSTGTGYTSMKVNGKSQQIEINRDMTLDDTRGIIFEGSTAPSVLTNKLYRNGSDIYWNSDKLGLDSSITNVSNVVNDLSSVVLDLSGDHNTLNTAFIDLSGDHNTLNTAFLDLSGNHNTLNTAFIDLSGNHNTLNTAFIDLSGDHNTLNTAFLDLSGKVVTNTSAISTIKGNGWVNETIKGNATAIASNTTAISNNTTKINSLTGVVDDLSSVVLDLSSVVLDLSGDHNTLNTAFIDLSGDHNTLNIAFIDLSGRLGTNTTNISTNTTNIATKVSKAGDTMTGALEFVVGTYGGRVTTTNDGLSLQTDNGSNRTYNEKIRILDNATNLYTPTYHSHDLIISEGKGVIYDNANSANTKLYYDKPNTSLKFGTLNISNFDTSINNLNTDVNTIKGNGWVNETIKGNATAIATNTSIISTKVSKTGDTMTGDLSLNGNLVMKRIGWTDNSDSSDKIHLGRWEIQQYILPDVAYQMLFFRYYNGSTSIYDDKGYLDRRYNVGNIDFTGQHRQVITNPITELKEGMILVSTGQIKNYATKKEDLNKPTINEALPILTLSTKAKMKSVFGVYSGSKDINEHKTGIYVSILEPTDKTETFHYVNGSGEGAILVNKETGTIENGDFIMTSSIKGIGCKSDSDNFTNYTIAKATQHISQAKDQGYGVYLISCLYML